MSTVHVTISDTAISLTTEGIHGPLAVPLPALPTGGTFSDDIACLALPPLDTGTVEKDQERVARLRKRCLEAGGPEVLAPSVGATLFNFIFPDQRFVEAYRSGRDADGGLRLVLEFDLGSEDGGSPVSRWAALPWEYTRDPQRKEHPDYLALRPGCRLVRRLRPEKPVRPFSHPAPLEVLATFAEPWTQHPYGRTEAVRGLAVGIAGGAVRVTEEPHPTFPALVRALAEQKPQVLHVMAHGSDPSQADGTLALEDDYGGSNSVPAGDLAAQIAGSGVGLVVLISCFSGSGEGVHGFRGIAHALLRAGVPSVLAMQCAAPVKASNRFAGELYRALARGTALDEAVAIARRLLHADPSLSPLDWAIPVLYMQSDRWKLSATRPRAAQPPAPQRPLAPTNLVSAPGRPLRLYGRAGEMIAVARAMREPLQRRRFVTVAGMGGIGKTALALESAFWHRERHCFPDGVFWVSARDISSHLQLLASVGTAARIPDFEQLPVPAQEEALLALVARRKVLLVVDNADSLRESEEFLGFLERLDPTPAGCLLLTSRRRMGVDGESPVELDRLPVEAAVALFLHGWGRGAVPREEVDEVRAVCGRGLLDGHPLAIVLASAVALKERLASLASLRDRLRDRMVDVLRSSRTTAESEVSLEASLGLSYDALSEGARQVLARCSVFERPFRLEAVEAVAGDVAGWRDAPVELMDHHLMDRVHAETSDGKALALFSLHPVVRAYSLDRAGDLKALRLTAGKFLAGAEYIDEKVEGVKHLAAAGAWSDVIEAATSIQHFLDRRGMWAEDEVVLQAALRAARALGRRQDEGTFLGELGSNHGKMGDARRAIGYYEQALAIFREISDRQGEGAALGNLGTAYRLLGDARKAIEHHEQALAISRVTEDRRSEGNDLGALGLAYADLGEVRRAIGYYEQALAISREMGDRRAQEIHLGNLGPAYYRTGEVMKAIAYFEEALAIDREIGDRRGEVADLNNLGLAFAGLGEAMKAMGYYQQALAMSREIGDPRSEGSIVGNLGLLYSQQGDFEAALGCLLPALAILHQIESPNAVPVARNIQKVREKLGEEAFKALLEKVARELGIAVSLADLGPPAGPPEAGPSG